MMRKVHFLLTALLFAAFMPAKAQLRWIADAPLAGSPYKSLYGMLQDGKPAIIAVGTLSSQSAQYLLSVGVLQDLASAHGAGPCAARFSDRELRVVFIDVRVFPELKPATAGVPIISMSEDDETFSKPGWDGLYSILGPQLFLVTPDHLVRPLKGTTAAALYAETQFWNTKVQPNSTPDLRLLDAAMDGDEADVRVQNFSTGNIQGVDISIMKDGAEIASAHYSKSIASLEDAVIPVKLPRGFSARLTIVAKTHGDANSLNNSWSGLLHTGGTPAVATNIQQ